jgi:molecular chaperone DnaK (HSP70)
VIDIGDSFCTAAVMDLGNARASAVLIPLDSAKAQMPTAVAFTESGIKFGQEALDQATNDPSAVITELKVLVGL